MNGRGDLVTLLLVSDRDQSHPRTPPLWLGTRRPSASRSRPTNLRQSKRDLGSTRLLVDQVVEDSGDVFELDEAKPSASVRLATRRHSQWTPVVDIQDRITGVNERRVNAVPQVKVLKGRTTMDANHKSEVHRSDPVGSRRSA